MSPVIDVHTHMVSQKWLDMLRQWGAPKYQFLDAGEGELPIIECNGSPFFTLNREMFDYEQRIRNMNRAGIDISIVSLTAPNCFFGDAQASLAAAQLMNEDMAAAQRTWPDRIRFFASIPWQHPELAVQELQRARSLGAVGVMVIANIDGACLTDPLFAPVWQAIDDLALPVLVHPTVPQGGEAMDLTTFNLAPSLGFCHDTSLAIARCIHSGFLDTYPNLKLIASHGGGTLPYLVGRLDICHERIPACRSKIAERPSNYMRRIYVDSVVYRPEALAMCVSVCGPDNVLFGTDYPHNIGDAIGGLGRVNGLPGDVRHLVRGGNATRIFGL